MPILNRTRQTTIAENFGVADTMFSRMKGLLGKDSIGSSEALVITRCRAIHMFFMRFPIDVIFVSRDNMVVGLVRNIKPFRTSPCFSKGDFVIECSPGTIDTSRTASGDVIELIHDSP